MEDTFKEKAPHLEGKLKSLPAEARLAALAYGKAMHDKYVGEFKIKTPGPGAPTNSPDIKTAYQELSQAKISVRNDATLPKHVKEQRLQESEIHILLESLGCREFYENSAPLPALIFLSV